jgi:type II secretory ATPase GspE/PulE/Tfp pilus assembly ATPase PilB-like protein
LETAAARQLIIAGREGDAIEELARREGMTTLRQAALALAASGQTCVQEALKVMLGG